MLHADPHAEAVLDGEDQHGHELARLEERLVLVSQAEAVAPHALRVGVGLHGADHEQKGLGEDEVQDEVLQGAVEVALQPGISGRITPVRKQHSQMTLDDTWQRLGSLSWFERDRERAR